MYIIQLIILAFGLSMDSLAISLTSGAIIGNHKVCNVLKIAGMLGLVQMLLTVVGWYIGSAFVRYIDQYDHWFAFGILSFLGIRMIWEGVRHKEKDDTKPVFNPLNIKVMFGLAIATSIDALAVGLSLSLVNQPVLPIAVLIGVITFLVSALGIIFGSKAGQRFELKINVIGGIILILIGCSILAQHTIWATEQYSSILQSINFA